MLIIIILTKTILVGSHFAAHTLGAMKNTIKTVKRNTIPFFFFFFFFDKMILILIMIGIWYY
jgi:hypothetical protein